MPDHTDHHTDLLLSNSHECSNVLICSHGALVLYYTILCLNIVSGFKYSRSLSLDLCYCTYCLKVMRLDDGWSATEDMFIA